MRDPTKIFVAMGESGIADAVCCNGMKYLLADAVLAPQAKPAVHGMATEP